MRSAAQSPSQIYRCGSQYSHQPCAGATAVQADDSRTSQQASQAASAARRDARLAEDMQRDRQRLEAKAAPANIPPPKRQESSVSLQPHMPMANVPKKPKVEPKPFTASGPQKPKGAPLASGKPAKAASRAS